MRNAINKSCCICRLLWLLIVLLSISSIAYAGSISFKSDEPTFPVLETKTGVYTNATVTQQTKDWIVILHSKGVCNIKISDLSDEAQIALGYMKALSRPGDDKKAVVATSPTFSPFALARVNFSNIKFSFSGIKSFAADWKQNGKKKMAALMAQNPMAICVCVGILGAVYVFVSTCFWLICRKTHISPGPLVWVPVLQLIPLLRAANMPRGWFFAYFIPGLNIVAQIIWCIKIVQTRGKKPWVAFLLVLPITNLFAFLYLAFSTSAPVKIEAPEILALELA